MRTVDLARAVGLSAQQVRNYEAWGFLPSVERSESGYRLYTERHLEALRTVRTMIFAGYGWHQALEVMHAVHGGDLDTALARVDSQHAELDRRRRQVEHTLEAIRMQMAGSAAWTVVPRTGGLRVGEAAKVVGVRPSAMRFWEQQGLLQPGRDERSGYRLYDQRQMQRLQVVVLLRGLNYGFDAIRSVLDELAAGKPESTLKAVEKRRDEIASAARACAHATMPLPAHHDVRSQVRRTDDQRRDRPGSGTVGGGTRDERWAGGDDLGGGGGDAGRGGVHVVVPNP